MDEEKHIDEYIKRHCWYYERLTDSEKQTERKIIKDSIGFAVYRLIVALAELGNGLLDRVEALKRALDNDV